MPTTTCSAFSDSSRAAVLVLLALGLSAAGCGRKADLLAGGYQADMSALCRQDSEGRLQITIVNQGKGDCKATTTQIEFASLPPVRLPTRPLRGGEAVTVLYRIPEECFQPSCAFRILVDANDEVAEINEANNSASGDCPN